jgi:intein/homing endonuclease
MTELGKFVFLRTYSRYIASEKRRESYKETIARATEYNIGLAVKHLENIGYICDNSDIIAKYKKEAEILFEGMFNLKQWVSGRSLWSGGTPVSKKFPLSNFNCAFTNIDKWPSLCDLFYLLLVGTGVGIKCTKDVISKLSKVKCNIKLIHSKYEPLKKDQRIEETQLTVLPNGFVKMYIGDSKEGWVQSLGMFFDILTKPEYINIHTIKISYNSVRPKGERLKTFGGTASGPEPLQEMFDGIDKVLKNKVDPNLSPIDLDSNGYGNVRPIHVLDIGNYIGNNVVVGGVRRCLPGWSLVHLKRGLIPIKNVVVGDEVLTADGFKKIVNWFDQGMRRLVSIETTGGFFQCTSNHRMPVVRKSQLEWVEASRLKNGDTLVTSSVSIPGTRTYFYNIDMDGDIAWLLGVLCTKDVLLNEGNAQFTLIGDTKYLADTIVKYLSKIAREINVTMGECAYVVSFTFDNKVKNSLRKFLNQENILKCVLEGTLETRLGFIAGLIDGQTNTVETNKTLYFSHTLFASRVQTILYSCGISSAYSTLSDDSYERGITYMEDSAKYCVSFKTRKSIMIINNIPQLHTKLNWKLVCECDDDNVSVLSVKSINHHYHTYDITVEEQHNFFCNGYLSHNTAEICLFDYNDTEMLFAKYGINGFWTDEQMEHHERVKQYLLSHNLPVFDWMNNFKLCGGSPRLNINHRRMSNNSVIFKTRPSSDFMDLVFTILQLDGEPGFINIESALKRRPNVEGVNPCAEILCDSKSTCNLTTINITAFCDRNTGTLDYDGLLEAQRLSVRCGLRMTLVDLELPLWDKVQKRDRLEGASLTGIKDAMDILGYDHESEMILMSNLKQVAREEADRYAKELRIVTPLLVTTLKPEGTLSQIAGSVSPGLHYSHSRYYIRRIRINKHDPLVYAIKELGWIINPEVGTKGRTHEERMSNALVYVVDFPVKSGAKTTKNDISAEKQLENYFDYQKFYTEHNSSNTITVQPHEWDKVKNIVYNRWDEFVGGSFLAADGGTYQLSPYEECTEIKYTELVNHMKPLDMDMLTKHERQHDINTDIDNEVPQSKDFQCSSGVCPFR